MEELRPGIIKYLLDRCGIANVARYPKQVLTDQFDDWKRVTETRKNGLPVSNSKYTLLTYPYKDNDMQNGGVFYLDAGKLANLHQQLKQQGSRLRVSEIGFIRGKKSRRTLRTLLSMVRDFGPCDVFIAGAHGDKKGMNYHQGLAGRFGILDLLIAARHRHKIVKDGGQIVLSSCLTGADGGLAEAMAKEFGVRVDAPEEATVEKKWHLASEKVNGEKRLRLWPVYRDGRRRTWKPKKP
jgi:hypothetical protein